ncbi:hypothetical protein DICPUDRAFT_151294 [Dictyostelium purpureum]|uniref:Uncharacterized protein n=1 Tax=Dictyostelium purpureum TaxID=5786 RepID=F0ZIH4_DICPU|nr:uncharacterized protein DICPUDRAFT_151294 [Dictyostelium purpureum]EGC36263.1 hypothetical protein DICPUDRAFT_151294 [Dictyostelium purpureum]|eukprot:XP_003287209.1 hypothetical protein DICPUDRAFT_151294 [Dictyostelium purpureum]
MSIFKNITLLGSNVSKSNNKKLNENSGIFMNENTNNTNAKWNPRYYLIKCKYFEMTAIA